MLERPPRVRGPPGSRSAPTYTAPPRGCQASLMACSRLSRPAVMGPPSSRSLPERRCAGLCAYGRPQMFRARGQHLRGKVADAAVKLAENATLHDEGTDLPLPDDAVSRRRRSPLLSSFRLLCAADSQAWRPANEGRVPCRLGAAAACGCLRLPCCRAAVGIGATRACASSSSAAACPPCRESRSCQAGYKPKQASSLACLPPPTCQLESSASDIVSESTEAEGAGWLRYCPPAQQVRLHARQLPSRPMQSCNVGLPPSCCQQAS